MKLTDEQLKKIQEFWNTFDEKNAGSEKTPFQSQYCGSLSFELPEEGKELQKCAELKPGLLEKLDLLENVSIFSGIRKFQKN